jgi:hypothetical protein
LTSNQLIFAENHAQGRGELCPEDLKYMSEWTSATVENLNSHAGLKEKILHAEGESENILLAERFRSKFPDLLPEVYAPELLQGSILSMFTFVSKTFRTNFRPRILKNCH